MDSSSGFLAGGKQTITNARIKNINAAILMGRPHLPNEKCEGSRGCEVMRLQAMEPMEMR